MMLGKLASPWVMKIAGGVVAVLVAACAVMWIGWGNAADARDAAKADLKRAKAQIDLLEADLALKQAASVERAADTAQAHKIEKDLINAISEVPDEVPGPIRVRLGCQRLRHAGISGADLPKPCGSDG